MIICLDYGRLCYSPAKHSESAELAYFFALPQAFRPIVSKLFFFSRYFALITWLNGICFHGPTYTSIALLIEQSLDTKTEKVETAIQNNNRILKLRTTEGSLGNYPGSKYSCNVS